MQTTDIEIEDMAVAGNVVLKRTARVTVEYGIEQELSECSGRKPNALTIARIDDSVTPKHESKASTSGVIAPTASAMESSPNTLYSRRGSTATVARPSIELEDTGGAPRSGDSEADIETVNMIDGSPRTCTSGLQPHEPHGPQQDDLPVNFGQVIPHVYRSSFPKVEDYPFFRKLGLKTVITLVQKDFPTEYQPFLADSGIKHYVFDMEGTKKRAIPMHTMSAILRLALSPHNHPLLIHCNHGRHRTGCVVAAIRKLHGWHLDSVLDEYRTFAEPKIRECDIEYITGLDATLLARRGRQVGLRFSFPRFRNAAAFTLFVLCIWLWSGAEMSVTSSGVAMPLPTVGLNMGGALRRSMEGRP